MKNSGCALWRNPANLTEKQQIVVLVWAGILGLAAIFAGIGWIRMRMMRDWVQTTGQITTKSGGVSEGLPAIYPTFRWQDEAGNEYRRTSNVRASLGPRAGQLIPVRYDPKNPQRAILDTFVQSGKIFVLIGAFIAVMGVLGCLYAWWMVAALAQ